MGRTSKSGVKGLFRRTRYFHPTTGERISEGKAKALEGEGVRAVEAEAWEIDHRWRKIGPDGRMLPQRYTEKLADGIKPAAARAHMLDILNSIKLGTFNPDAPAPVRLHAALDRYLQWSEANRPKSHAARATRIGALKAGLADMALESLAPWHVEAYKRRRLKQAKQRTGVVQQGDEPPTVRPATVNREVSALKHFIGLAASGSLEGANVGPLVAAAIRDVPMLTEPPGRVRSLTHDEERRLLAALPDALRPIVEVADLTGMRRAEVALLKVHQIDMRAGEIVLTHTKANRNRRVPISPALESILAAALTKAERKAKAKAKAGASDDKAGDEHLFPSRRGFPYSLDAISRGFHRAVERAGLADLRFHDLRHDAATKLRRRGHGLDVIAKLLGHADIKTTGRYAHVEPALLRAAVADLPSMQQPTTADAKAIASRRRKRKAKRSEKSNVIAGPLPGAVLASAEN